MSEKSETKTNNGAESVSSISCYPIPEWVRDKVALEWNEKKKQFYIDEADYVIFSRGAMDMEAKYDSPWRVVGIFDDYRSAQGYADWMRRFRPEIFGDNAQALPQAGRKKL